MMATAKPLHTRTAADLMSRDVVVIPCEMSLRAAARRLAQARVTGAPVVDASGRCIGILSATDFVFWAEKGEGAVERRDDVTLCGCTDWELPDVERLPADEVSQCMTPDVVTAEPSVPIAELARAMLDAHIHRVIVVDGDGRPVGVVSSMDILAAVAAEATAER